MARNLIEQLSETPEERAALERERVILEVTEMICALMEEQGVSRSEFAKRLGTSKSNLTQLLDGRRNMTLKTVTDLLFHLGRSLYVTSCDLAEGPEARYHRRPYWHMSTSPVKVARNMGRPTITPFRIAS